VTGKPYPFGIDCVWLALDGDGHVGAFVSAGAGPIPERALACEHGVEDIEKALLQLPRKSTAQLLIADDVPSFVDIAERGLFVYDWQDVHRNRRDCTHKYEPVAKPINPISAADLNPWLFEFARCVTFEHCRFVDGHALPVASLMPCRSGE
jgi:hypothetical protein